MVDSARGADTTITEERQETATPRDKESWQYIEDDGKKIIGTHIKLKQIEQKEQFRVNVNFLNGMRYA